MSEFKENVLKFVSKIPKGKVSSYGKIAALSGSPRAARQVGGILRAFGTNQKLPWWRVVNSKGEISIKGNWEAGKELQKQLLLKEGVSVDNNFQINLKKYEHK